MPAHTGCATACMARCTSRWMWPSCRKGWAARCGVCCQKVSEAEVFARGGIKDVLVSNQVRDPAKIDRLARLPNLGARAIVCVDDLANVADLSAAAEKHGAELECFVEIDCGAGRCGVTTTEAVVEIAKAIDAAPGLKFTGIQAYQGAMQHLDSLCRPCRRNWMWRLPR